MDFHGWEIVDIEMRIRWQRQLSDAKSKLTQCDK